MLSSEYEELKQRLLDKRHKGNITRREEGYNEGVECAVSMIREVYRRQFEGRDREHVGKVL